MPRTRTIYNTQALYVSQAPAVAMQTGNGDIKQLSRIQNFDEDFVRNYTEIFQYGTLGSLGQLELEEPTINANFSYYITNGWNEKLLGLDVYPSESIDNYSPKGVKKSLQSCISNLVTKTTDEKNYYLLITEEGNDAINYQGSKSGVIGIGNGYITSYVVNASVGSLPTAEVEIEGLNVRIYDNLTSQGLVLRQVNKIGGYVPTTNNFGASISVSQNGRLLFVGDGDINQRNNSGEFYVFGSGPNWNNGANYILRQRTSITGSAYGQNIASNETGSVMVIGALNANSLSGEARIYTSSNFFTWTLNSTLSQSIAVGGYFGASVAISASGDIIAIGRGDGLGSRPGAVHILTGRRAGTSWAWQPRQIISGNTNGSRYGMAMTMSRSGDIIIMGGPNHNSSAGAAIVLTGNAIDGWAQRQILSGLNSNDQFGGSLATNYDGSIIIMGGIQNDIGGNNAGGAMVFTGNAIDGWALRQILPGDSALDNFGRSVATNYDGSVIVMGGMLDDDGGNNAGAAIVFTGNGNDGWKFWQKITGDTTGDQFGRSVMANTNSSGNLIMMGGTLDDDFVLDGGAVLIYNSVLTPIPDPIPSIDVKNNISTNDKFFNLPPANAITGGISAIYPFADNGIIGGYVIGGTTSINTHINPIPSVLVPGDVIFSVPSGGVLGFDTNDLKIQDFTLSLDLARRPIQKIGNRFAFSREIDFPVAATLEINAEIGDISNDNLIDFLCDEKLKNFDISIKEPGCDFNKSTAIAYLFRGARLVSQSISKTIGDNGTMSATYEVLLGGPNDFSQGVFISGSYSNRCPKIGNSPWLRYSLNNQGGTQFSNITGWVGPLPPNIGGYVFFVGGYLQGLIDEFPYPYSQFRRALPPFGNIISNITTEQFNLGNWEGFSNIFTGFSPNTGYLDVGNGGFVSVTVNNNGSDYGVRWWSSNQTPTGLNINEKDNFILPTNQTDNFFNFYLQSGSNENGSSYIEHINVAPSGKYFGYLYTGHRYLYFQIIGGYNSENFSRDFVKFENLNNHGFGPEINFQRDSQATYFNSGGVLRFAPHNMLRNSQAAGLTNGVIGDVGVMPTYWAITPPEHNTAREIIGTGIEDGLNYIDIKISGTPTVSSAVQIWFETPTRVVATSGQTWVGSVYTKLAAGATTGVTFINAIVGTTSAGAGVAGQQTNVAFTPTSGALKTQRTSSTRIFSDSAVERVYSLVLVEYTSGNQIGGSVNGITLRIAAPQLERNISASEYILTSGSPKYDQPRFDYDPITLKNKGLLIEATKTNFVQKSQEFNDNYWFKLNLTTDQNAITAPDNTLTADAIIETTGSGYHATSTWLEPYIISGSTATISVFAKAKGRTQFATQIGDTYGQFDLLNETAQVPYPIHPNDKASITPVGNGWYRCSYSTDSVFPNGAIAYVLRNSTDSLLDQYVYSGIPNSGIYLWGAQVESGNFATSYIPTFSGIETRKTDAAFVTPISSFYNQNEGTLFAEASQISNNYGFAISLDDNTFNRIAMSTQFYKVDGNEGFVRDFSAFPILNHGVGPSITFTRNTNATYFDSNGMMRFAPHNEVRNSEVIGTQNGLIWNNAAFVGAGVIPDWGSFVTFGSMEVVGSGTELGMRYVDVRISGANTSPSAGAQIIGFNAFSHCVASSGQTWTSSADVRLVGGSLTNVLIVYLATQGRQADTTSIEAESTIFTPSNVYQRVVSTKSMTNALTERVSPDLTVIVAPSSTVDLTLRIAAPQLERNISASEYIPTTGTAKYDQPRFDYDPITKFCKGLLIEESRTNLIESSKTFLGLQGTGWTSVIDNNSVAPDGTTTATRFEWSNIIDSFKLAGNFSTNDASEAYTASCFVKPLSGTGVMAIQMNNTPTTQYARAEFNLGTNTVIGGYGGIDVDVSKLSVAAQPVGSGWHRVTVTATFANSYNSGFTAAVNTVSGSGAFLAWGVQLEKGAFATSYIPTTTGTYERAADNAFVTPISGFYNQSEGTIFVEASAKGVGSVENTVVEFSDGSVDNVIHIGRWAPNSSFISAINFTGERQDALDTSVGTWPIGQTVTGAFAYKFNDLARSLNGDSVGTDTLAKIPVGLNIMTIGYGESSLQSNGHIRKIIYWPTRLSNQTLQDLTSNTYSKDIIWPSPIPNTNYRHAFAYKSLDYAGIRSGNALQFRGLNLPINTMTHLRIGGGHLGDIENLYGHIRKIAYYPKRLNNTLLENLVSGSVNPGNLPIIYVSGFSGSYDYIDSEFGNCIAGYGTTIPV